MSSSQTDTQSTCATSDVEIPVEKKDWNPLIEKVCCHFSYKSHSKSQITTSLFSGQLPEVFSHLRTGDLEEFCYLAKERLKSYALGALEIKLGLDAFKFSFDEQELRRYLSGFDCGEDFINKMIKNYFDDVDSSEFIPRSDLPPYRFYLETIKQQVLSASNGLDLETSVDLIAYLPSPLLSRSSTRVPRRIKEMIAEDLWAAWQDANAIKDLEISEAFKLFYQLFELFAGPPQENEARTIRFILRSLQVPFETTDEMVANRTVSDDYFRAFTAKYLKNTYIRGLGRRDISMGKVLLGKCAVTGADLSSRAREKVNTKMYLEYTIPSTYRYLILTSDSNTVFDEPITPNSHRFVYRIGVMCPKHSLKFFPTIIMDDGVRYQYLDPFLDRDMEMLDVIFSSSEDFMPKGSESLKRFREILMKKITEEGYDLVKFIQAAPKLYQAVMEDLQNPGDILTLTIPENRDVALMSIISKTLVDSIIQKFAEKPTLTGLGHVMHLVDLKDDQGKHVVIRECFLPVLRAIIVKGSCEIFDKAVDYKLFSKLSYVSPDCAVPGYLIPNLTEYLQERFLSATLVKDIDKEFIRKVREKIGLSTSAL